MENKLVISNIKGGLGNQLFQYATGLNIALKNKAEFKLDISFYKDPRFTKVWRLDQFNIPYQIATEDEIGRLKNYNPPVPLYARTLRKMGIHNKFFKKTHVYDSFGHEPSKKILKAKRKFYFPQLQKVIPQEGRVIIWGEENKISSFEEANFTNSDIKKAFAKQNIVISIRDINSIRKNGARKSGLIKAIEIKYCIKQYNKNYKKPQLDKDLVTIMLEKRRKNPGAKHKTQLENFVIKTGKIILLNNQPKGKDSQKKIFSTGLMG